MNKETRHAMHYDAIPTWDDDHWMLHILQTDWDTGEAMLVGPCGGITYWEDDFPSPESQAALWARYYRYVMESGDDCLEQIILPTRKVQREERWQIAFLDTIIGIHIWARKNGRGAWLHGDTIPQHVRDFCDVRGDLSRKSVMDRDHFATINALKNGAENLEWGKRHPYSLGARMDWCWIIVSYTVERKFLVDDLKAKAKKFYKQYAEAIMVS